MSGMIAMESQINGIITEYLEFYEFEATIDKFKEECNSKGKTLSEKVDKKNGSMQKVNYLINEMMHLFNQGQRKEFFRHWMENIPIDIFNNDIDAQKLEIQLYIHFAVFYYRKNSSSLNKDVARNQSKEGMNAYKNYMETKGHIVSQMKEFLPYFGMPYADNPLETFPELFSEAWLMDVQQKLETFLKKSLKISNHPPQLLELYEQQFENKSTNNMLQLQINESEKKAATFFKKFNKSQADYHVLIGITAELVDSLENTISGKPVAPEYLSSIISRLFSSQMKQSLDLSRPGTAGAYIRQSVAYQKSSLERPDTTFSHLPLDFFKIKHDLLTGNERRQLLLLQALRWRLTRAESAEQRQKFLNSYIVGDLLNCRNEKLPNHIIDLIKNSNDNVRQYIVRLVNTLASLNHGRSYLASNHELIKNMHYVLRNEKEDSITKQNLIAALQKLSLRRNLQTLMIQDNVLEWLVSLLENNEELSDYSLEYASALFMNLSLRSAGKKRLAADYKKTLKIISELLGNSNTEIRPFINGTLYSILTIPSLRKQAKIMNFEAILEGYLSEGTEEMRRQIEFLIKQINSNEVQEEVDSDIEDGDEDEEDDPIIMEANLDRGEIITKQSSDELLGDTLLQAEYSISNEQKLKSRSGFKTMNESIVLDRPITPSHLRQSVMLQTKPFNPSDISHLDINQTGLFKNSKSTNNRLQGFDKKNSFKLSTQSNSHFGEMPGSKSTNILVINSTQEEFEDNAYVHTQPKAATPTSVFTEAGNPNSGFASRPKIQRTPDQSMIITQQKNILKDSINAAAIHASIQSASSSSFGPKFSVAEPRPSTANSIKSSTKSPVQSNASTLK